MKTSTIYIRLSSIYILELLASSSTMMKKEPAILHNITQLVIQLKAALHKAENVQSI